MMMILIVMILMMMQVKPLVAWPSSLTGGPDGQIWTDTLDDEDDDEDDQEDGDSRYTW